MSSTHTVQIRKYNWKKRVVQLLEIDLNRARCQLHVVHVYKTESNVWEWSVLGVCRRTTIRRRINLRTKRKIVETTDEDRERETLSYLLGRILEFPHAHSLR